MCVPIKLDKQAGKTPKNSLPYTKIRSFVVTDFLEVAATFRATRQFESRADYSRM